MRWAGHVERMGVRGACRVLLGKPEGMRPLGRLRHEWENSVKWIFEKCDGAWSGLIGLRIGTGGGLL
jgi:hypothetical protein